MNVLNDSNSKIRPLSNQSALNLMDNKTAKFSERTNSELQTESVIFIDQVTINQPAILVSFRSIT